MGGMFGVGGEAERPRASANFYRNFFALLTFLTFALAVLTNSAIAFLVTLVFATLSRVAVRKGWRNPPFAKKLPWLVSSGEQERKKVP